MAFSTKAASSPRDEMTRALSSTQIFKITTAASRASSGAATAADLEHLRKARLLLERLLSQDTIVPAAESNRLATTGIASLRSTVRIDEPGVVDAVRNLITSIDARLSGQDDPATRDGMTHVRDLFGNVARGARSATIRTRTPTVQNPWPQQTSLS